MTDSQKLLGGRGCKVLGIAAHASLKGYAFIAQEDTVVTVFTVGSTDSLAAYGLSTALKAGAYIVVPSGEAITAITLTSGSVIVYNQ
tara:strand:- start:785 stop:1045 length:261 start_codon:yes stop_codon:yes gene_type:complete